MKRLIKIVMGAALLGISFSARASDNPAMDDAIARLQHEWANIKYKIIDKDAQLEQMEALARQADGVVKRYADRAEPLIWDAIITSTQAGMKGGFSALGKAKAARRMLEAAQKIDPKALNGSAETSLGSLYYQVPGFPIGFGSNKKARRYLEQALAINPDGIDPNYFYGDFLYSRGEYQKAAQVLRHALDAPARPQRPLADQGRRREIRDLLAKIQRKIASR